MARVSTCPKNLTEVEVASTRLKCGADDHGHSQYMCLPNVEKTSLVEFCYKDTLGIRQKRYGTYQSNKICYLIVYFC